MIHNLVSEDISSLKVEKTSKNRKKQAK